ncbi:MAG: DUF370 domain-containing protein [Candidatus Latescibacteria bacterium]|nr:DUF370 domain-containing protein [bacterium]MBD3422821.1 DUF370 domain-containing protein [Candidatus Latescibacterota bacterium]
MEHESDNGERYGKKLLNIGFGSVIHVDKIVIITPYKSSPVRRYKEEMAGRKKLIDLTQGRKTRSLVITTSDQVILSAVGVETLIQRLEDKQ